MEAAAPQRNAYLLTAAQALGSSGPPVIISLGGLVGQQLAPNTALITLPVSLYTVGLALSTIPMATLMRRSGRQPAYLIGNFFGICAGLIGAFGIVGGSFWLFSIGCLLAGINGAAIQSYRFAVTDSVAKEFQPRAISMVMIGGLIAAIIGPQMVIRTQTALPGVMFAGSFIGLSVLTLLALPPLLLFRSPRRSAVAAGPERPLLEIVRTPRFVMAAGTGVVSYALMSFVMTSAPLAMIGCGLSVSDATLGIQWHSLAMFAPSFFTGKLIERFGAEPVTAAGLLLIAVGAVVALMGLEVGHFWANLVLLGLGWNFGFVGATSMIAALHRPEERVKVQGFNDFLVFGTVAIASLASGEVVHSAGWAFIAWMTFPIVGAALLLILFSRRAATEPAPAPTG